MNRQLHVLRQLGGSSFSIYPIYSSGELVRNVIALVTEESHIYMDILRTNEVSDFIMQHLYVDAPCFSTRSSLAR